MVKALAFRFLQFAILWPLCFGSMAQGDDHGDTPNDATQIQIGNSFLAELESSDDVDFFRFEISIPGTIVVESSADVDTFGLLITEAGVPIVAADDTGSNLNFLFQAELNPGTYFLGVSFGGLGFPGSYRIRTEFSQSPVADDHGDQLDSATPISIDSSISGVTESTGDIDFFRVEVTAPGVLTVRSTRPFAPAGFFERSDTLGTLLDSEGNLLAVNDESGLAPVDSPPFELETVATDLPVADGTFEIVAQVRPGTYFVAVQPFNILLDNYIIEVGFDSTLGPDDHGDTIQSATPVDDIPDLLGAVEFVDVCLSETGNRDAACPDNVFVEIAASIETPGDRDVFRVELTSRGVLTVGSLSFNDVVGRLLNERGGEIDRGDDGGFFPSDFVMQRDLDPGVYSLEVGGFSDAVVGPYHLDFAFRPSSGARTDAITMKLEEPVTGEIGSGVANIRGWAVSPVPIDRIELFIDGLFEAIIPYGGSRGDVGRQFPDLPDSDRSGFSMAFLYGLLSSTEPHTFTVKAFDVNDNFNQDTATFAVESFDESVFSGLVDLSDARVSITGPRSLRVQGMVLGSGRYDVGLEFRRATQSFSIESIERTGSVARSLAVARNDSDGARTLNEGIRVTIEEPAEGSTYEGVSNIRGWSIGPGGISHVDLFIDGAAAGRIPFGGSRQDVSSVFPGFPNSGDSGFSAAQNYSNLGPGEHAIRIVAVDPEGRFNEAEVNFDVAAFPDPFIKDISRIDASAATPSVRGNSILLRGMKIDDDVFDLTIEFRKATQNFAITSVTRRAGMESPTVPPPEPPIGAIVQPSGDLRINVGDAVSFGGGVQGGNGAVSYAWDFGNQALPSESSLQNPEPVTFNAAGSQVVTLRVADSSGIEDPDPARVTVTVTEPADDNNRRPIVDIVSPIDGYQIAVNRSFRFQAEASDPDGDAIEYRWVVDNGSLTGSNEQNPVIEFPQEAGDRKITVSVEVSDGRTSSRDSIVVDVITPSTGR